MSTRRSLNSHWFDLKHAGGGALMLGLLATGLVGCSSGLETGYTPRPLGVSSAERRAYYASPYTPEAAAAEQAKQSNAADNPASRRPNLGPRQY